MATFIIREMQNAQSSRKGETIEASDLSAAKRAASRKQMFQGTVMTIESERGTRLAVKESGRWTDL